jgi:hypothetical protein
MADDSKPVHPSPLLLVEDVNRFLVAKKVVAKCPKCPNEQWQTLFEELEKTDTLPLPIATLPGGVSTTRTLRAYPLVCTNCGYIWLVARSLIESWLAGEGKNAE